MKLISPSNCLHYRDNHEVFSLLQGSRPRLFYDVSTGEFCPLRIPFDRPLGHEPFGRELRVERLEAEWLRAAVSPIDPP